MRRPGYLGSWSVRQQPAALFVILAAFGLVLCIAFVAVDGEKKGNERR